MARRGKKRPYNQPARPLNLGRLASVPRDFTRFDGHYQVSQVRGNDRSYTCPACTLTIAPYTAHIVAWRTDSLFESGPDYRRHWHIGCWQRGLAPL